MRARICSHCGVPCPSQPVEEALRDFLSDGNLLFAIRLLTRLHGWSITQAKQHCDQLNITRRPHGEPNVHEIVTKWITSGDPRRYAYAVRLLRAKTKWGPREVGEYLNVMYPTVDHGDVH